VSHGHGVMERYVLDRLSVAGRATLDELAQGHPSYRVAPARSLRSSLARALRNLVAAEKVQRSRLRPPSWYLAGYEVAIHEAAHAVIGRLAGLGIERATVVPTRGIAGQVLYAQEPALWRSRQLWREYDKLRKTIQYRAVKFDGYFERRAFLRKGERIGNKTVYWPADDVEAKLRKLAAEANAIIKAQTTPRERIEADLLGTLAGPVSDYVFFGEPFERPRAVPIGSNAYRMEGNLGATYDFQSIGNSLAKLAPRRDHKRLREEYRARVETMIRDNRRDIERLARGLLDHKTLDGGDIELALDRRPASEVFAPISARTKIHRRDQRTAG
jgi:hypothetical protein